MSGSLLQPREPKREKLNSFLPIHITQRIGPFPRGYLGGDGNCDTFINAKLPWFLLDFHAFSSIDALHPLFFSVCYPYLLFFLGVYPHVTIL